MNAHTKILLSCAIVLALLAALPQVALAQSITWAVGTVEIAPDVQDAIEVLLLADPPVDATTEIYAITHVAADGGNFYVSLVNLEGIVEPYDTWVFDDNVVWLGTVYVVEAESVYIANYYTFEIPEGGGEGLVFPWQAGTIAMYGMDGVHGGTRYMENSLGVDFFGGNLGGSNVMPALAYAVADGTVDARCTDDNNTGVRIAGSAGTFYYLHLDNSSAEHLQIGTTVRQGDALAGLVYGSFSCVSAHACCGGATQQPTNYHLHFAFTPTDGYFIIEGCQLNVNTQYWVCGSQTISPRGWLPVSNGGSGIINVDPGEDVVILGGGGEHIWDGLVGGVYVFYTSYVIPMFPEASPIGLATIMQNSFETMVTPYLFLKRTELINFSGLFIVVGIILAAELVRIVLVIYRWILRMIPAAG